MARMGIVGHSGSDGSEPDERIRKAGVYASKSAENVARDVNIISAQTSLMQSLSHRENILDSEVTHAAVGIAVQGQFLYVTELFVRKLPDFSAQQARTALLEAMNKFRDDSGLPPVQFSRTLTKIAQAHVEVQEKLDTLSQPLLTGVLAKQMNAAVRINVYTTANLQMIPEAAMTNLKSTSQAAGIGYKRIRGPLCRNGCYLITLILGPPE
jgi:hypothetical protein